MANFSNIQWNGGGDTARLNQEIISQTWIIMVAKTITQSQTSEWGDEMARQYFKQSMGEGRGYSQVELKHNFSHTNYNFSIAVQNANKHV